MVDFDIIRNADWFALPVPFQKGISFPLASILGMGVMSIAVAIETIGDLAAITKSGADREITAKELSGGLMVTELEPPWSRNQFSISPARLRLCLKQASFRQHSWT